MAWAASARPAAAVELHNLAARWHRALLVNAARPSGALVYDPPDGAALSADQFARLKEELAAQFSGAANAGRPLLLDGGLKWQALSLTPADMDIGGLKAAAARDIALAFGVPPMLLGLPGDATYANYREANRALWRLTVLPMAERILRGIGDGLAAWRPGLQVRDRRRPGDGAGRGPGAAVAAGAGGGVSVATRRSGRCWASAKRRWIPDQVRDDERSVGERLADGGGLIPLALRGRAGVDPPFAPQITAGQREHGEEDDQHDDAGRHGDHSIKVKADDQSE